MNKERGGGEKEGNEGVIGTVVLERGIIIITITRFTVVHQQTCTVGR